MTIREIRESGKDFLTAADVAGAMGCDPHYLRVQAHEDSSKLQFPVCVTGKRIRIPREGFLRWYEGSGCQ